MTDLFHHAGLKDISEKTVSGKLNAGSTEVYWNFMTEVVAPVVAALSNADTATKLKIKKEVFDLFDKKYPKGNVAVDSEAIVISGKK